MSDLATRLGPPRDLKRLESDLVHLATSGRVACTSEHADWLVEIGVATLKRGALLAHPDWLACALPCPSSTELLTRTALRDPRYRLHVDAMLAAVCADIGRSARWKRLEDLLTGPLADLAPRLASLVATTTPIPNQAPFWSRLDEHCWGLSGTAEVLFPLVVARMPSLCDTPVFVRSDDPLLGDIVRAAAVGDGIRVDSAQARKMDALFREGVPVWVRDAGVDQYEACLTLAARVEQPGSLARALASAPFSLATARVARQRSAVVAQADVEAGSFWASAEGAVGATAFLDVAPGARWPEDGAPAIPSAGSLRELVALRRAAPGSVDAADEALRRLADHPLYGLWLQVLLLEALDRELGESSLFLSYETVPGMAELRVYYRPRPAARGSSPTPMLLLGSVDEVLARLSSALHIREVGLLGAGHGPWSRALELLAQVDVVSSTGERWAMAPHVLDRLHGGGLMTGVLRRGKDLRERLHGVLDGLWSKAGGVA